MDFLASPMGVMLILGIVAVAAFRFEPARYQGVWRDVAKLYETDQRPSSITFPREEVSLGSFEVTQMNAAVNDGGLWMLYDGPEPPKAPKCVLIPWDCIRFKGEDDDTHNFQIRVKGPVEFYVSPSLGNAMQRRCSPMPAGVE
jgi:hypothetical protein